MARRTKRLMSCVFEEAEPAFQGSGSPLSDGLKLAERATRFLSPS
jgi:hypothetical protein